MKLHGVTGLPIPYHFQTSDFVDHNALRLALAGKRSTDRTTPALTPGHTVRENAIGGVRSGGILRLLIDCMEGLFFYFFSSRWEGKSPEYPDYSNVNEVLLKQIEEGSGKIGSGMGYGAIKDELRVKGLLSPVPGELVE